MMETIIASQTLTDEEGNQHSFEYCCITRKTMYDETEVTEYGIGITQDRGESIRIPGITSDRTRFEELANLLIRNGVTPISLPDVLEDWL